jgi:alanyl-tRNA synthetase
MTRKLFHEAPNERQFEANVVGRRSEKDGLWIELDQTLFYPLSGGQLADHGELGSRRVLDVHEDATGSIWHRVDGEVPPGTVAGRVDWERRLDHMQQHSGQHLLSAALIELFDAPTISFHMGDAGCTIDVDRLPDPDAATAAVEDLCARVIGEHREVRVHLADQDRLRDFRLRKPPQVAGIVRLIEIDAFDVSPCGGTHVANSAEIGAVRILRSERVKQGLARLTFLCGARVHRDHRRKLAVLGELGSVLSQTEEQVAPRVRAVLAQMSELSHENQRLWREALQRRALELAAGAPTTPAGARYVRLCDRALGPDRLAILGRALADAGVIALLGGGEREAHLCLIAPRACQASMRDLLAQALPCVHGRGGGSADQAHGGGPFASGLEEALAAAEAALVQGEKA